MPKRNILLGFGETLTRPIERKKGGGGKSHPYTYLEARKRLLQQQAKLLERINTVPDTAAPEGIYVARFTLHPAYLAKSYHPGNLLRKSSLQDVGSKRVVITPEKTQKKGQPTQELTSCLYVAGKAASFKDLYRRLEKNTLSANEKKQIIQFEEIDFFEPEDKIRTLQDGEHQLLDVALHTPFEDAIAILDGFSKYVAQLNGHTDLKRRLSTGGITFVPVEIPSAQTSQLAAFTTLRVLRGMPELRINEPSVTRQITSNNSLQPPTENAVNQSVSVAVFDGGLGTNALEKWCKEEVFTSEIGTNPEFLHHGNEVTSTILFGPMKTGQTTLPTPLCNIDHYRVLDPTIGNHPDLYDVLHRIKEGLAKKQYDFVNLSLGPRLPIDDEDINPWTAVLDQVLSSSRSLMTVAVGNDGMLTEPLNRIQPPSDMVNGFAIGASDSRGANWARAPYSSVGPGRSPGFIKPDAVCFGGSENEGFTVYNPLAGGISHTYGTSYAAPLALRHAIELFSEVELAAPITAKALLIHCANASVHPRNEVGWGHLPSELNSIIECDDSEATIIYQGELVPGAVMRATIPYPEVEIKGNVTIKATLCYLCDADPEHPINYTRSGLDITFRKDEDKAQPFFKLRDQYQSEQEARGDAHKWETTLHASRTFQRQTLSEPCFDIDYQIREQGRGVDYNDYPPLPYCLVVTVSAKNTPEVYNGIRQQYQTLQPVKLRNQIPITIQDFN
ncbi:S8 family peptidase [uncultured Microbulbifer sp.]|uniref:S8 family peptidase n=1 Tax=uncultured Microbulbifer sp. TaxID=348147 RepID=UPI00260DD1C4|nr:S8 family peptidase [uncultured Microbulbifer sp.]